MRAKNIYLTLVVSLALASCEKAFPTHPYDVNPSGKHDINRGNIEKIEAITSGKDTVRVAFISDTHEWYSDTRDEVDDINRRGGIDFVVHCGDLTDMGMTREFERTRDLLEGLAVPYVAMIGNHDFLGTGKQTYRHLFGEENFSLVAGNTKLVCVNTNATEYDYVASVPDFEWLLSQSQDDTGAYTQTLVVMHAPPFSDQFNNNVAIAFRHYLGLHRGLLCCIYGHNHTNKVTQPFGDSLTFYGISCAQKRNYRIFTLTRDGYEEELVYF